MNDSDISQFLSAFEDFMKHAEEEINDYLACQEAQSYTISYYEDLASKYEITVDYLMAEFILD